MCADKWPECSNGGLGFLALWVYGFMSLSPHASLSERSTIDWAGTVQAEARLTAVQPRVVSHRAD